MYIYRYIYIYIQIYIYTDKYTYIWLKKMTSLRLSPEIGSDWGNHPGPTSPGPTLDALPGPFAMRALTEWPWWWTSTLDLHVLKHWGFPISVQCFFFFSGKISYTWLICGVRKVVRTMNGGFNSIIIYTWLHIKVLMRKSWTSGENHWTTRGILQQSMFDYRMVAGWIWITELEAWGKSAGSCSKSWTLWFSTYIWDR